MANAVIIPLDDRPCTSAFPAAIAGIGGWTAAVPPVELLGSLSRTAQFAELGRWLELEAAREDVRGLVLSIDTLGYGGTTAARRCADSFDQVRSRLAIVPRLKERQPDLPVLAFAVIMRLSDSDSDEEEKPYWRDYGRRIYAYSFASDRLNQAGEGDERAVAELGQTIPAEVLADYVAGRARNHRINLLLLEWVTAGVLDELVLTQDDTGAFGFNVDERRKLQAAVAAQGLESRVLIYPGADEVASTLVARLINRGYERHPHVYVRYCPAEARRVVTRYEDRPLDELVDLQLRSAGAVRVDCPQEAQALLFVHGPGTGQRDLWLEGHDAADGERRTAEEAGFIWDLKRCLEQGRQVALADVTFANGADDSFMSRLAAIVPLHLLLAYAAWNTAGNTIGTSIAHLSARLAALEELLPEPERAEEVHAQFLVERLLDDWLYQGRVRAAFKASIPTAQASAAEVSKELEPEAMALFRQVLQGRELKYWRMHDLSRLHVTQPWGRLFEAAVGFRLHLAPSGNIR